MRTAFVTIALISLISCWAAMSPTSAHADEPNILAVTARVDGIEVAQRFSLRDLQAIGTHSFVTSTIWTDGPLMFTGVTATAFLRHLGITSGTLEIIAANDYFVEIPVAELQDDVALIAYFINDEAMSTRDKGPLWLVYPYDSDVRYQSETYYSRSIWQINRIKVLAQ